MSKDLILVKNKEEIENYDKSLIWIDDDFFYEIYPLIKNKEEDYFFIWLCVDDNYGTSIIKNENLNYLIKEIKE